MLTNQHEEIINSHLQKSFANVLIIFGHITVNTISILNVYKHMISGPCRCTLAPVLGSPSEWPETTLLPEDIGHGVDRLRQSSGLRAPFAAAAASNKCIHSNTCPGNLAMVEFNAENAAGGPFWLHSHFVLSMPFLYLLLLKFYIGFCRSTKQ